ncbi:MAG: DUF2062 domain-containing protein [Tepidisphaerales bacterium]
MPRKFFRKFMPPREKVDSEKLLRFLKPVMDRPYLWHLNRHSVARGVSWGLFWALIPIPGQSVPAVLSTIWSRGNLALAIAATWLSNPFTLIPHWWSAYTIGKFLLRSPGISDLQWTWEYFEPHFSSWSSAWRFVTVNFWHFYLPLLVGSIVEGVVIGGLAYVLIMTLWRRHSSNRWLRSRARASQLARPADVTPTTSASPAAVTTPAPTTPAGHPADARLETVSPAAPPDRVRVKENPT